MKFPSQSALVTALMFIAGCADQYSQSPYSAARGQVISSPKYGGTTTAPTVYNAPSSGAASEGDQALANQLRQALYSDNNLANIASRVNVSVQNGTVTLTGAVPSDQDRQAVDTLAHDTTGVNSVVDQLQIGAPTGRTEQETRTYPANQQPTQTAYPNQQPGQTPYPSPTLATGDIFNLHVQGLNEADRGLAQRILQGLRTDTLLASLLPTVNINVSGGRVILQGTVQTEQQKQAIATIVQRAAGTSNVENQLQVAPAANQ